MAKLIWNELKGGWRGWRCERCDALYGTEEVARMFNYDFQTEDNFVSGYCMDCGTFFEEIEKYT